VALATRPFVAYSAKGVPRQKSDHVDSAAALAGRLRAAREGAGLSQRALAHGICTPAYVSRLEKGERIPSLQLLRRLAERLDADADELASGVRAAVGDPLVDAELALRLGESEDAERVFRETLEQGSRSSRARALTGLGRLAFERGDHRAAIELLEAAAEWPQSSDAVAETLGRAYAMVGELESAIAVFERARDRARERTEPIETLRFSVLLANALMDATNFGRAAELLGDAIVAVDNSRDPILRARLWWSQSRLHAMQDDPETAARYARRALETLELTEHAIYAARAHQLLAHIELNRSHPQEALDLLETGYPLIEQSGNRYEQAMFKLEHARAFIQLGRSEEAAAVAMEASGMLADASPADAGRAYAVVADVFAELGDRARALELYELADETLPIDNRIGRDIATRRAELLEQEGRKDEALEVLKRAMQAQTDARAPRSL
jgi:tetratricopeptide (TPR) repeat protein